MTISPATSDKAPVERDRGSVTPLVIGMMLCLLILGAGVIAAGSAVLARRNLQSACDGAADAVAAETTIDQLAAGRTATFAVTIDDYLHSRVPAAVGTTHPMPNSVAAHCEDEAAVTFGVLFGNPTVHLAVDSVSSLYRR